MINHLPPFLREIKEFQQIFNAVQPEIELLKAKQEQYVNNWFISTTDLEGIKRYEKMLKITPLADDTLQDRQLRAIGRWNSTIPYNEKYLRTVIEQFCGTEYELTVTGELVKVKIPLSRKNQYDALRGVLEEIVPMHLPIDYSLMYNTHEILEQFTHEQLEQFTHEELFSSPVAEILSNSDSE